MSDRSKYIMYMLTEFKLFTQIKLLNKLNI